MRFAQFWHGATGFGDLPKDTPIPACGDRAVIILDARHNVETSAAIARDICKARGYIGFSLHQGASLLREREIRKMEKV